MSFKLKDPKDPFESTHGANQYLEIPPAKLVEVFGPPEESDGCKVSGEYRFDTPNGGIITVYDWKSTTLYDDDFGDAPTPEELWASEDDFCFHLGGNNTGQLQINSFIEWIDLQLYPPNSVKYIKED